MNLINMSQIIKHKFIKICHKVLFENYTAIYHKLPKYMLFGLSGHVARLWPSLLHIAQVRLFREDDSSIVLINLLVRGRPTRRRIFGGRNSKIS